LKTEMKLICIIYLKYVQMKTLNFENSFLQCFFIFMAHNHIIMHNNCWMFH
jgi:hypothetical protein